MAEKGKLLNLESLRGIAAILVAFFHLNTGSHFHNAFTENAWLLVDFFFVLSGFVISLNYQNRLSRFNHLINYQKKRFLRLYPLHIIMLMVLLCIETIKYLAQTQFQYQLSSQAFSVNNIEAFIANLFLLQNWLIDDLTFNIPSWSISAEFLTYFIFAVVALAANKYRKLFYLASALLLIVSALILKERGLYTDTVSGPARCIYSFFIGVFAQNLYTRMNLGEKIASSLPSFILVIAAVALVSTIDKPTHKLILLVPPLFGVLVLLLVSTRSSAFINRVLANDQLVYLGAISYGIYMIHFAVWWFYAEVLTLVFGVKDFHETVGVINLSIENRYVADLVSVFGILLVLLLAHFSYKFVEKNFTSRKHDS